MSHVRHSFGLVTDFFNHWCFICAKFLQFSI